jgi:glycine C-acetyltransferase/8-amino-7-oxononanoate synthase
VERLRTNARTLRRALATQGFAVSDQDMHIVPLIVGDERDALRLCQEALERGVFAQAIRPPTVPAGTSRLRLTVMASHTDTDLRMAAAILGQAAIGIGLDPMAMGVPEPELEVDERPDAPFDLERETAASWAA